MCRFIIVISIIVTKARLHARCVFRRVKHESGMNNIGAISRRIDAIANQTQHRTFTSTNCKYSKCFARLT